jgi:serine/threonine protein kinase
MECLRNSFRAGVILGDRYQTVSPLNHGSFGLVFMARDLQTRQLVAIKCTTKRSAADEACLEIAIDDKSEELFLHSHLGSHPNIVNLLDSFETESHTYIVLEFCQRGDLYEAIRMGHGPLETEHVRQFMTELMDAVEHMHAKGIYHRDIKPENIFLTQSGSIKLGDFGLATTEQWSYETSVGSDRYMSPEQYDSAGAGYSPAQADIWAIGVVLLNVLFSRNPFTTPTESDPLFLDFSRDKQALFDVFPSMSQDTYEVIVQCMNLDPRKRSLDGARDALQRVVSFTTLDEALDDFCTTERRVVASANREPLRTPSIQSPVVDNGAFPWAKALHAGPKPIRQLSTINDNESYTEDLFSKSAATKSDWLSGSVQTSSLSSMLESSFGASMQSLNITMPKFPLRRAPQEATVAGSLPISMIKPRNTQSAMSMVFGRKDAVSKSWSDLWDEDEEEQEEAKQLETLKEMNSRTWSHDSKLDEFASNDTPRQGQSPVAKSAVINIPTIETTISDDIDGDLVADGFFFHETPAPAKDNNLPKTAYSPPSKSDGLDKWAALGERRRGIGHSAPVKTPEFTFKTHRNARDIREPTDGITGHSNVESHTHNPSGVTSKSPHSPVHHHVVNKDKRNHHGTPVGRDRAKDCPWNQGREHREPAHREPAQVQSSWNWSFNWRNNKEKRVHQEMERDMERVGGWHTRPVHHL